ncbi:MAG: nucleotidyl transferase AbiEii/AbiGii toxin family protein [Actinobacteria bacterium]|nr:nucleotidyl transferase AbiEii/AbiGii toxin family protein [Actinomycetota bacterium]
MINYFQIQRLASKKRVPEDIIEKDYFIELLLYYLSNDNSFKNNSVFRGGTSLKKMYFPDYRFSEDLDFIVDNDVSVADLEEVFNEVLIKISNDFPFKPAKTSSIKNDRLQTFIKYDIVPEIKANKELKVDILKDNFIPFFSGKNILFTYPDFRDKENELNSYDLESVVADKISRILDADKEVRDIYDLWYLLKLDYLNISKLKNILKKRFGFKLYFPNLIEEIKSNVFKQTWKFRLERQILDLPPYELVIKDLNELIKNKFID